ncbi:MAG: bifunctional UDP-N-acetylglucosamine diphosphorylase/glucosamine-1-phosphate N-acetyltransferase GlmU [Herpetosiphonaceae bacterium]|nr:bifunctional UDP-N-acetylglucosamine diphosphorylase/glucosamine-1-phosphate N-acetyltransferase GlmU [Herpetosiphonaceae bacterium]
MQTPSLGVVILAAGDGTRMHSTLPKVLHPACGLPLVEHVLRTAAVVGATERVLVLAPTTLDQLQAHYGDTLRYAVQHERRGTAHALLQAHPLLAGKVDRVLVLYGADPTMRPRSVQQLVALLDQPGVVGATTTFTPPSPTGYGRIIRDPAGHFVQIVEERNATPEQRQIREVNQGVVAYNAAWLWEHLAQLRPNEHTGEFYLTDLVEQAVGEHGPGAIATLHLMDPTEGLGVNDRVQLAEVEVVLRERTLHSLMLGGVTVVDPSHTYVDMDVSVGQDTVLLPGTILRGATTIGANCVIGPHSVIENCTIGIGCVVRNSVLEDAIMEDGSNIGPFSHLRKGAHLGPRVHVGNFGEVNRSVLHDGVKMGHFSYIGDADVGAGTNIGAGTITANYDGKNKNRTVIGAGVFIGSDSIIIAPRTIGAGARTGAGSVVNRDVDPDATVVGVPARQIKRKPPAVPPPEQ